MKQMWKYFREIAHIPHGSGNEAALAEYLIAFAKDQALSYIHEPCGNVIIKKPGTKGKEKAPTIILQCHMDMVCEKNSDSTHNFATDRLQLVVDGDWIYADKTTLGADNGIGLVMALAVLAEKEIEHPPLEVLFTVEEETGLVGASSLDPKNLKGTKLINLDSDEEGVFFSGCAGGARLYTEGAFPTTSTPKGYKLWQLGVTGFPGGHSGVDIDKNVGNPILIGAALMAKLIEAHPTLQLATLVGGGEDNAIPRELFITFALPSSVAEQKLLTTVKPLITQGLKPFAELNGKIELTPLETHQKELSVLQPEESKTLITTLESTPHGVIAESSEIPGVVETSTNLASVHLKDGLYRIVTSQRSFIDRAREKITAKVTKHLSVLGARSTEHNPYPGWAPNSSSPLIEKAKEIYLQVTGEEPKVTAIHAGLECGILKSKLPHLDCISFGPNIEKIHTPQERASISSGNRMATFLVKLLSEL